MTTQCLPGSNSTMMISAFRDSDYLGVRVHALPIPGEKPANLAFLIDVSDSMTGERLAAVKKTLHSARTLFRADDRVTLVTFGESAHVIANNLSLADDGMERFYEAIDAIRTDGCTNMSAGFELLLTLQEREAPFDALLLLTDGNVNHGIMSTAGLRTMAQGLGRLPITALGYGADHNRVLLRDLALTSRGSYVFVASEMLLPTAIGDLIGGIRTEILKDASIQVPAGWTCCELGGEASTYRIGNVVSGRDYWAIFRRSLPSVEEATPIVLMSGREEVTRIAHIAVSPSLDLQEQVLRTRVGRAIVNASDQMEQGYRNGTEVAELIAEFETLGEELMRRPLVLRMKAQLAEVLSSASPSNILLARMASGGTYLSVQRGVTSDPDDTMFSSDSQRATSTQVQKNYTC